MDFSVILNSYILPTGGLILMALVSWGLKELVAWLKEQKAKTKSERKKMLFSLAIGAAEEIGRDVKQNGNKMPKMDKETVFRNKLTEFAKNEKVTVTNDEIDSMLKGVLGEMRLNGK